MILLDYFSETYLSKDGGPQMGKPSQTFNFKTKVIVLNAATLSLSWFKIIIASVILNKAYAREETISRRMNLKTFQ